jgi:hypothetical protein
MNAHAGVTGELLPKFYEKRIQPLLEKQDLYNEQRKISNARNTRLIKRCVYFSEASKYKYTVCVYV